jgi:hypothetical protein
MLVVIIGCVTIYGLVFQRKHYEIFYQSIYQNIVKDYQSSKNNATIAIIDSEFLHRKIESHYFKKWKVDSNFVWMDSLKDFRSLCQFLAESVKKYDRLYLGAVFDTHPSIVPIIQEFYPKMVYQHDYMSGNTYLFSKGKSNQTTFSCMDFEHNTPGWTKLETIASALKNGSFEMDSTIEYSPTFEIPLSQIIQHQNDFIDISVKVKPISKNIQSTLVSTLDIPSKNIDWRGVDFFQFIDTTKNDTNWTTIYHSIKLSDIVIREKGIVLKVLVWNPHKNHFLLDDFKIHYRKGNPKLYGFFYPL